MLEKADLILLNMSREKSKRGIKKMLSIFKSQEDTAESLKKIFDNISACVLDLSSAISAKNLQLMDSIKVKQKDMDDKLAAILERISYHYVNTPEETIINKTKNMEQNGFNNLLTNYEGNNKKSAFPQHFNTPTLDEVDWGKSNILIEENHQKPSKLHIKQEQTYKLLVSFLQTNRPTFLTKGKVFEFRYTTQKITNYKNIFYIK
jgi:hypothetical protein